MEGVYKIIPLRHPFPICDEHGEGVRSEISERRKHWKPHYTETPALTGLVCGPAGRLYPRGRDKKELYSLSHPSPCPCLCFISFCLDVSHPFSWPSLLSLSTLRVYSLHDDVASSLFIKARSLPVSPPPRLVGGITAHAPSAPLLLHPHPLSASGPRPLLSPSPPPSVPPTLTPHYSSLTSLSFGPQPHSSEVRWVEGRPAEKGRGESILHPEINKPGEGAA